HLGAGVEGGGNLPVEIREQHGAMGEGLLGLRRKRVQHRAVGAGRLLAAQRGRRLSYLPNAQLQSLRRDRRYHGAPRQLPWVLRFSFISSVSQIERPMIRWLRRTPCPPPHWPFYLKREIVTPVRRPLLRRPAAAPWSPGPRVRRTLPACRRRPGCGDRG